VRALRSLHEFELREVGERLARDGTNVFIGTVRGLGVCVCGRRRGEGWGGLEREKRDHDVSGSDDIMARIVGLCSEVQGALPTGQGGGFCWWPGRRT
jgi:hypothetical protein